MARCFVTRALPGNQAERIIAAGHELDLWPSAVKPSSEELREHASRAEGLLCMLTDPINEELLAASGDLRVISTMAVGYDNIDMVACRDRAIPVGHTPDVLTEATADLTLALLLALARRIPEGEQAVRNGLWGDWQPDFMLGIELRDLTLGIVGPGRIGNAVARRAQGFGMNVIFSGRPGSGKGAPLDELLATSDVVSLHCPLTDETRHLADSSFLEAMKPTALLINTTRGGVVDQKALKHALTEGVIAGAALDVTDPEPLAPDDPLLDAPNLLVVPHIGSATLRTRTAMASLAVDNLLAGLAGEPLPCEAR